MKDDQYNHGLLGWFVSNHVAANLLMVLLVVAGILTLRSIKIEIFPELSTDVITISVPYLGASPAEVNEGVIVRIEEAIVGIEGIKKLRSTAAEGIGTVIAEVEEYADTIDVLEDIKAEIDRITTFPKETEKPIITELTGRTQVITIVLYGQVPERTLKILAEKIRDDLSAMENISQVNIAGVRQYEISIEVSEKNLRKYDLTFDHVANAVRQFSVDLPGGSVKTSGGEILIRTKGQKYEGPQFEQIIILSRNDGSKVFLGDIARVIDGFEDSDKVARFDGKPAATINVYRVGDQGALDVANTVKRYVEEQRNLLPEGVSVATWFDRSLILRSRMELLIRNAYLGLILVFLSLTLFLDITLAFWTTMGIPISFLGAFWLLPKFDVSINMISLFAFIICLGLVVDDAIVVGENIFSYRQQGIPPQKAAIRGVKEMAAPVINAVLTTVLAFAPLLFITGIIGKIIKTVPVVVISVLLVSLIEALLILPAHLSGAKLRKTPGLMARMQQKMCCGLNSFILNKFSILLDSAVSWRYITLAISIAILVITVGFVSGGHIKFTLLPKIEADNIWASLTMPQGTLRQKTEQVVEKLEEAVRQLKKELDQKQDSKAPSIIQHMATNIGEQPFTRGEGGPEAIVEGAGGTHLAEVNVELLESEKRDVSSAALANRWREIVGDVPGVSSLTFTSSLFTAGEAINIELTHQDFPTLLHISEEVKKILRGYEGVIDITDDFEPGKGELTLSLKDEAPTLGLTLSNLARQVRQGFYGEEAQRIQRGRNDVRVMVRYPDEERKSFENIENMRIRTNDGTEIPFSLVAKVEEGRGYAAINRLDRRIVVTVTADVDETTANANEINQELQSKVLPQLQGQFPGLTFKFGGQQEEQAESLGSLKITFIIALLAIFALLAIQFKSYIQPVIVMSAIPFGLIGAIAGHMLMGFNLSLLSLFGIVALAGVVVNDSLIMIDLINHERATDLPLTLVVRDSATRRFRPILLTTMTTFFGLTPMILEKSLQARFLIPMAISLGFGVVFATAITLVLVPSLYMILEDIRIIGEKTYKIFMYIFIK